MFAALTAIKKQLESKEDYSILVELALLVLLLFGVCLLCTRVHMYHSLNAEVEGELSGLSFLLSSCSSWGLNSGH